MPYWLALAAADLAVIVAAAGSHGNWQLKRGDLLRSWGLFALADRMDHLMGKDEESADKFAGIRALFNKFGDQTDGINN